MAGGKSDVADAWAVCVNDEESVVDYEEANLFSRPAVMGFHPQMSGTDEYVSNQYNVAVVHRYKGAYYTSKEE